MEFRYLLVQQENQICRVTLNRPERLNALNVRIGVELLQALKDCDRSPEVRVVIVTGAGRAFCAGDDLRGMTGPGEPDRRYLDPIKQYVEGEGRWPLIVARMRAMSKPVIAMINGHAHGAGFNLALGCDLRVMAETATLAIPFAKRGIATGTNLLQQFVGIGKAMEWALLAPTLSAAEAERWGLVNRVVPLDRLEQETTAIARELAEGLRWCLVTRSRRSCMDGRRRRKPRTVTRGRRSIIRKELRISLRASRHFGINAHRASAAAKALTGREETAHI
jgi:enoyl-CoA hydratase/carnithine racemase